MAHGSSRPLVSLFVVGTAVAALAFVGSSSGAATGAATTTPTTAPPALPVVNVSPTTGLVDLQTVTVTGHGFSPNVQIGTVECRPGALAEPDCDLGTLVYASSSKTGTMTLSRYVRRIITVGGKQVDCAAAKGCILGAGNVGNLKQANGRTIFFNPKVPPKVATLTVTPNTKLVDHQLVSVSGKGFPPSTNVYLSECVTQPPTAKGQICDYATQRYVTADAHGTFTATNVVLERRQVVFTGKGTKAYDCAATPGTCAMEAGSSGLGPSTPAKVSLTFDPKATFAVAAVALVPSTSLTDLESVTVTGSGYTPGYTVNLQECVPSSTKLSSCDYTTTRAVTAGFHGGFTVTYSVRRDVAVYVAPTGTENVDCAAKTGTCELTVQGTPSQQPVNVPLTFDAGTPPVTPAITATPNTGLTDNENVAISLDGFVPNQQVQIVECSADAISEANLSYCDYSTGQVTSPTSSHGASTTFVVRSVIGGQSGLVDCTTGPGACVLVATENGYYYGGAIGVTATTAPAVANRAVSPRAAASAPVLLNVASTSLTFATP